MNTLEKLLSRLGNENTNFEVKLNDNVYQCHKIPFGQLLSIDENHDTDTELGAFERNQEVIYECCPLFEKALGTVDHHGDPFKIVGKLLQPMEVYVFYGEILNQYVNQQTKDVDAVKKP